MNRPSRPHHYPITSRFKPYFSDIMNDKDKILVEYMKQSPNRYKVLRALRNETLRPSQIAIVTDIHISSVSKSLTQLREVGLVRLLNPDFHMGRLYQITAQGLYILELLE